MTNNHRSRKEQFPGSEIKNIRAFDAIYTRDSYALLARANHRLAFILAALRDKCTHLTTTDCFECLSPHEIAA